MNTDSKEEPMEVPEDQSHPPVESGDAADLDTATTVIHHHASASTTVKPATAPATFRDDRV